MHEKALALIHECVFNLQHVMPIIKLMVNALSYRLSLEEDDIRDRLEPAIRYLQKLGPEHLELIFKNARWVIDVNHDMGLQVRYDYSTRSMFRSSGD